MMMIHMSEEILLTWNPRERNLTALAPSTSRSIFWNSQDGLLYATSNSESPGAAHSSSFPQCGIKSTGRRLQPCRSIMGHCRATAFSKETSARAIFPINYTIQKIRFMTKEGREYICNVRTHVQKQSKKPFRKHTQKRSISGSFFISDSITIGGEIRLLNSLFSDLKDNHNQVVDLGTYLECKYRS